MTLPPIIPLADIERARERLKGVALHTPTVRLAHDGGAPDVYLKLETLQPIGSFKLRGAGNAMRLADPAVLAGGVWTASAGNMAQGVAWCARELGVRCTVVVPDHAPAAKTSAVERLGGSIVRIPFDEWWMILAGDDPAVRARYPGHFIHPVCDAAVVAGNGTIALEVLDDLAGVETIVVPYGGGGLSCGIASAVRQLAPHVRVVAAEVETAAPLAPALAAGAPVTVAYTPSFVDGIGGRGILPPMWPMASTLLDGAVVVSLAEIADALRLTVARARVVAEGAGAAAVAAALSGRAGSGRVVAIVSGGNIDSAVLATLLQGHLP